MPKKKSTEEISQETMEPNTEKEVKEHVPSAEGPDASLAESDSALPLGEAADEAAESVHEEPEYQDAGTNEKDNADAAPPEIVSIAPPERDSEAEMLFYGHRADPVLPSVPYGEDYDEGRQSQASAPDTDDSHAKNADDDPESDASVLPAAAVGVNTDKRHSAASSPTDTEKTAEDERRAFFGLAFNELDRDLTPEQRQEWNSIYASYRGRTVMRGAIAGLDLHRLRVRDRKTGEMIWRQLYCAIVIPFRVRILIPETEMWMKGEERPDYVLRNLPGAVVDFVIIHVDREAGFAVGSRRLALPARRHYFSTNPRMNSAGSRVSCDMLVVGPRRCLVSCGGFDIDLTQRDLSYTAIADLRDVYHSGQTLDCIVKRFDPESNRLSISVKETVPNPFDGAEFRHPVQSHRQGVIAGKYGGGVFCNLTDGLTVMCNYSFHYDDSTFRIGDRVMLIIQRYDDSKKQVYGKIVSKT